MTSEDNGWLGDILRGRCVWGKEGVFEGFLIPTFLRTIFLSLSAHLSYMANWNNEAIFGYVLLV